MIRLVRSLPLTLMTALAALAASSLQAQDLYWPAGGVTGNLTDAAYTDGVATGLTPTNLNTVWFGGGGIGTLSGPGTTEFSRLRIGHNATVTGSVTNPGAGEVTISGGAKLNLSGGASGAANAGLHVGNVNNGLLVIDGAGAEVTSNQAIVIGTAPNQPNRNGTVRITNGGSLVATAGGISLGPGGNVMQPGMQGHLFVENGHVFGASLLIGVKNTTSSFTLNNGAVEFTSNSVVGETGSGANNHSTFTMTGGTYTTGNNFFLGRGDSTGVTLNLSGGDLNVGNLFLMASVGVGVPSEDTNGDGVVNQSDTPGPGKTSGIATNHTGGNLNVGGDIRVGDTGQVGVNDSTYNLSGTGVLTSTRGGIIGRQGTGRFLQTGGTANFQDRLSIGRRENAANATDGLYKISAGTASFGAAIATDGLVLAENGKGEFRVVGDDATINVLGNLVANNTDNGVGTLAFELETGDLLSRINVTDIATFNAGSQLVFDVAGVSPTQTTYDLLTATDIVDNGLAFTGPAGWSYQIVAGGNGEILQAFSSGVTTENADFNDDGTVDGADFLAWQRGFGATSGGTLANGDANADGAINDADLTIWKNQYGTSSATPVAAAVPEPAAVGLLAMAGLGLAAVRRR